MLATVAFLAFWILVGLALFFIAMRRGPRGKHVAAEGEGRGSRRAILTSFLVFYVAVGIAVPALLITGNEDNADAHVGGTQISLTKQEVKGRELFGQRCANCHVLAAAESEGPVGPNLDQLRPPAELVYDAIVRGRQRGGGTMPAGLLEGSQAEDVAAFVAATAGR
ncbi:c-type cytochrome [Conexibacter woesei]|uniref:Cytochrome c domain-containing protein n=1 Tax=Conexibacter woesei (strain DSM 14684 / CCUG 47730 / CIP 108061 / JCM 11494 / NBRC 100937 / ID131577) TaxID=469383 RepID=D3F5W2_CONWI|nr:cytochrome c [Conexibacter woesei]ADB52661.1 hypothetical protein Cwoe_4247 [Conexibacter woesei DSM 14684]